MPRSFKPILLIALGTMAIAGAIALMPVQPAEAQCGSQASSCKSCHEVQGQDPVNAEGDWHVQHAFGDFCQFCHAGNVQAMDKAAAHAGMVAPLGDIQANCASCHPGDADALAQTYAAVLGVTVGEGGAPASAAPTPAQPAATEAPAAPVEMAAPDLTAPGVVDFNARLEAGEARPPVNWGDIILGGLIVVLLAGGGAFVVWNERRLRKASGGPVVQGAKAAPALVSIEGVSPEAAALLPKLERLNPLGKRALARLLENPEIASDLLVRLSRLDPALVEQLRGLDRETRELLLAMAGT